MTTTSEPIPFSRVLAEAYRFPGAAYDTVRKYLEREDRGLPAIPQASESPAKCFMCKKEVEGDPAMFLLCEACTQQTEEREAEEKRKEEAKRIAWENRPPAPWPRCWPSRAILSAGLVSGEVEKKGLKIEEMLNNGSTVALIGDRGRAKTTQAAWIANRRRGRREEPGVYLRTADLFARIKETWGQKGGGADEEELLDSLRWTPLLVLDEIQERAVGEWENRTLANLIDHRYAEMLPTLLIGNLTPERLMADLGPSIWDRLRETGGVVQCDWPSFRKPNQTVFTQEQADAIPRSSHDFLATPPIYSTCPLSGRVSRASGEYNTPGRYF